ncbi:OsmC family protein [Cognatiluteimonas profundi]|uniref:OsmC family protein n=1 Tax=Cognatiluteimonas profundi TaxID=2594501 RepID=UPI00131B0585|nr:OsmC family protein [Lysobacter profundi]
MGQHTHRYHAELDWTGNLGAGTSRYDAYARDYSVRMPGKPELHGSADPLFRGDPTRHNPEDLLLASITSCHLLSYLALCARHRISVLAYSDRAEAVMQTTADGGGRFVSATLHPHVVVEDAAQVERAMALHEKAHALCFIASSCNFPITHEATVVAGDVPTSSAASGAEMAR